MSEIERRAMLKHTPARRIATITAAQIETSIREQLACGATFDVLRERVAARRARALESIVDMFKDRNRMSRRARQHAFYRRQISNKIAIVRSIPMYFAALDIAENYMQEFIRERGLV